MSFNCFMHERNIYKDRPDFSKIAIDYPEFKKYALPDKKGKFRIDFNDPNALRTLTKILLKKDFDLNIEIPDGYLIPTVPQRLNYILWIEDLLTALPKKSERISGIDIGTGPCAILSLLGSKKNGWYFVSTETSEEAVQWAKKNIEKNNLESHIKVAKVNKGSILQDVMVENELSFDFCICNPPFFENKDDIRKKSSRMKEKLDLFAKKEEIFSDGGEVSFVKQLLKDSLMLRNRIGLYSSMFGKKKSFIEILKELQNVEGITYTKTEFCQGNTIRWGIAWTFVNDVNFEKIERPKPKKHKKQKPPLVHSIIREQKDGNVLFLQEVLEGIKNTLLELQIQTKIIKSVRNFAEIEISAYENTWSHQRRKRREQQKGTVHEVGKKTDVKDDTFSNISKNKPNLSNAMLENQAPISSKHLPHSEVSCADLKQGQTAENETKSCLLIEMNEEHEDRQKIKSDTVSLDTCKQIEANDSPERLQDSGSQKRKRDEDEPALNMNSDMLLDQDDDSLLQKNPDSGTSPRVKRLKVSEDTTLSNKNESEMQCDSSPKEEVCLAQSFQEEKRKDSEMVQTNHPDKTFKAVPLLYCIIKLRTTKENIFLEMNCPPESNRETMYQVFQLFRNKFSQC